SNFVAACFGQAIGTARLPSEMAKTTILIERVRKQTVKDYVALTNLFAVIQNQNGKPVSVPTTNIFALVEREEPAFEPLGSGCLLIYSNIFFIVTAGHVIPPDENVYFRVLKTNKEITTHYSHAQDKGRTGLGWIRSTNADVAITTISLVAEQDDVKCVDLVSLSATYDQVSIGDEVVVVG